VDASARYSTSEEDLDIVLCFFVFHDTRDSPKKMQYPVVDHRVETQEA